MAYYYPLTLTIEQAKKFLMEELEEGYDPIRIAKKSFSFYHDFDHDIDYGILSKVRDKLMTLMVMEMGPEFYLSEDEVRKLIESIDRI